MQANPSSLINYLHIINIKISAYGWKTLGKGIAVAKTLNTLIINLCEVSRDALLSLSEGMKTNASV